MTTEENMRKLACDNFCILFNEYMKLIEKNTVTITNKEE